MPVLRPLNLTTLVPRSVLQDHRAAIYRAGMGLSLFPRAPSAKHSSEVVVFGNGEVEELHLVLVER